MIDGIQVKVCGITALVDATFAVRCGADYLGFILYPPSPRHVSLAQYKALAPLLPTCRRVAVVVEPTERELVALRAMDFDFFQIHFRADLPLATVASWATVIGSARIWLAPKLPPGSDVHPDWFPLANHFLLDTFHAEKFGGTGKTGDWAKYVRHRASWPDKRWILSGGLSPDNITAAVRETGTDFIDVNSGVESAPGVKDHAKLNRLVAGLHVR